MNRTLAVVFALVVAGNAYAHGNLKFVNGKWFDGQRFVAKTMYSEGTTFRSSFDGEIQKTIDLGGKFVIPPFADAHNHALGNPATAAQEAMRFLRAGVFYLKNPNNIGMFTEQLRKRFNTPESMDVVYANGGLTATGGHPIPIYDQIGARGVFPGLDAAAMRGQAYFVVDALADLDREWPAILRGKPDFLKIYLEHSEGPNRGLDPAVVAPIVERAHGSKLRVTAHVASAADFRVAVAAGVDEIAHLPLEILAAADAAAAAKAHTVVVTTLLSHRPVPNGMAEINRANLRLLKDAGVTVVVGVDSDKNAVDEVLAIASTGVFTPLELLKIATEATPRDVFPERRIGCLSDGCEASFLALDGNPLEDAGAYRRIAVRVKQGHVLEIPADPDDVTEQQLNRLGYAFLNDADFENAIRILGANTKRFPQSANAWDSLAEAYLRAAIANYRKSLALDPKNENAAKILRQLDAH